MCLLAKVYLTSLVYLDNLLQVTSFLFQCRELVFSFLNGKRNFYEAALPGPLKFSKFNLNNKKKILVEGRFDGKWPNTVQGLLSDSCNWYLSSIIAKMNTKKFLKISQLLSSDFANICSGKPHGLLFMRILNFSNLIIIAHSSLDIWKYFRETWHIVLIPPEWEYLTESSLRSVTTIDILSSLTG